MNSRIFEPNSKPDMRFPDHHVPRWIILLIDTFLVMLALFTAYMLRFEFTIPPVEVGPLLFAFPIYMMVRITSFLIAETYASVVRYSGTEDSIRVLKAIVGGSILMGLLNPLKFYFWDSAYFLPFTIVIIDAVLASVFMILFRLGAKMLYLEMRNPRSAKSAVVIYGAGESGVITKRTIDRDAASGYQVIAFFDDDLRKSGKRLEGAPILHTSSLDAYLSKQAVSQLIVSIQQSDPEKRRAVIDTAVNHQVNVLNVPPVNNWINGELSLKQLKSVKIEDLLGRPPIVLADSHVGEQLRGQVVLITGAAGSIGSGLMQLVARHEPLLLIAFDQAESPLFELEIALRIAHPKLRLEIVIGDVRQKERLRKLFATFKPAVVYHAAAYKHVPLMELNPTEAVLTNVLGTKHLVDLSIESHVKTFVLISTDKAVNPTSVMGSSKRVAEIYAQASNSETGTHFITTRFGNVLGSNGSVIPLFRKQIEDGGPLTITHPDVVRFFMTIPEACQLVLEAGAMGEGGEIFVFDMGQSVRIADLADKMIRLSGLEPGKDIEIKYTGLRPGEKLFEELLASAENTMPTHHPRILRAKVRANDLIEVQKEIDELVAIFQLQDNEALIKKLKRIVPEYISNNSEFSKFDV